METEGQVSFLRHQSQENGNAHGTGSTLSEIGRVVLDERTGPVSSNFQMEIAAQSHLR